MKNLKGMQDSQKAIDLTDEEESEPLVITFADWQILKDGEEAYAKDPGGDLELDLLTSLELLGRVSDMFSFLDVKIARKLLGNYHFENMMRLDRDVAKFLNTTAEGDR